MHIHPHTKHYTKTIHVTYMDSLYKEPYGGSRYKKVCTLEAHNLDEKDRNMHQKIHCNLRYQMKVQKGTRFMKDKTTMEWANHQAF